MSRDWEKWDIGNIATELQAIWQDSANEIAHRGQLADIVSHYATAQTSILEVGCGTGLVYEKLVTTLPVTSRYTGVDSSVKMLEIARQNFPQGQFLYGDGYELVFRDQEFDVVLSFEVLGHIPEIKPFVSELFRVAKKTCIFTTWPSDGRDIVENYETINGVQFLHRRYSDDYVQKIIRTVGRKKLDSIELASLSSGGQAYIVTLHP
ncbi:class I SAM-dependent methyltransferase [Mesorhizobium amorphae]|uniref:Type 11 methyltransferase n=1 Tax=Mesorhizobium amorphae CCNWGS0123 TaxID=1082933 RepID=G6YKG4_9HYPH|nr:class I SAM-dependent methyltransferase [Mesorhizobium amorphae]ANT50603.1 hypothetical protein A6B35_12100 [Mesorhizobium amorphae CCNWGS0123]EHH03649.1 type 11 methyltransferase [Mesorhizobium amorphae CCNWGS0123]GLR42361.1 hypothetical protein GCM10007880_28770 [Mesorhizobium amorphae]